MSFQNMSLKVKIFILIFMSIFIPSTLLSMMTYKSAQKAVVSQMKESVQMDIGNAIKDLDTSLGAVLSLSQSMLSKENILQVMEKEKPFTEAEKAVYYPSIYQTINNYISMIKAPKIMSSIDSYYLYLPHQNTIITSSSTYYEDIQEENVSFLCKGMEEKYQGCWYATNEVNYYSLKGKGKENKLITYNLPVMGSTGEVIGICAINIKPNVFHTLNTSNISSFAGDIGIAGLNGEFVYGSGDEIDEEAYRQMMEHIDSVGRTKGEFEQNIQKEKYYVLYDTSEFANWRYLITIRSARVLEGMEQTKRFLVITIVISVFLIILVSGLLSRMIYGPIQKLVKAMQEIERHNLKYRIDDNRQDEYKNVYTGYNQMVEELSRLIEDLSRERLLNKEIQIKLLQEQINPHFLYNTLDSIYSIARLRNVPDIADMVYALSKFFRVSLSEGKDIVTLRDALDIVESYLTVQNIRFRGKFQYQVFASEELYPCRVPKLVLQPFVENAIYHGLEKKREAGELFIRAETSDEILYLTIEDNGAGMSNEKMELLQASLKDSKGAKGQNFAILNINTQIKLRYGEGYGVHIEGEQGTGTKVIICLPI